MADVTSIALAAAVGLVPPAVVLLGARRSSRLGDTGVIALTVALGALAFVPAHALLLVIEGWAGLEPRGSGAAGQLTTVAFDVLLVAPLWQALTVAAVLPAIRLRRIRGAFHGVVFASAAAVGLFSAEAATRQWGSATALLDVARALLLLPAHAFLAALWGNALGFGGGQRIGGRGFNVAWLGAAALGGLYDHLVLRGSSASLISALPILLTFIAISAFSRGLFRERPRQTQRPRILRALAPPSVRAVREALARGDRTVTLTWIAFGALVTLGVMTAMLVGAVGVGHTVGVDFAAVDRDGSVAATTAPLALLGLGALAAFPVAGFLVARASRVRTVLEPAMSAALAILASLVVLGLAAPVAVIFALAFAPVAFALACAGAWVALGR